MTPHEWTFDTLKEYLQSQIDSVSLRVEQNIKHLQDMAESAKEEARAATEKAERVSEKRFDSVNEFRGVLSDQQKNFVTRQEVNAQMDVIRVKIDSIKSSTDKSEGTGVGKHDLWGHIMVILAFLVSLVSLLIVMLKK